MVVTRRHPDSHVVHRPHNHHARHMHHAVPVAAHLAGHFIRGYRKGGVNSERAEVTDKYHPGTTVYTAKSKYRGKSNKHKAIAELNRLARVAPALRNSAINTFNFGWQSGFCNWGGLEFNTVALLKGFIHGITDSTGPGDRRSRIDLRNSRWTFTITNVTNGGTSTASGSTIDIYIYTPRYVITQSELNSLYGATATSGNADLAIKSLAGFNDGVTSIGATDSIGDPAGDGVPSASSVGFSLFDNTRFCRMFKIKSIKKVQLQVNESFTFEHNQGSRWIDGEKVVTGDNHYLPGVSEIVMFKGHGMPTSNSIFAGSSSLSVLVEEESTYKYVDVQRPVITNFSA